MKEKIKKIKKLPANKIKYEWQWYAKSYLELARIGCEELYKQNYRRNNLMDLFFYNSKHLLIPIFFNIKHSLEIFLKELDLHLNKNYWTKHDLNFLLSDFKGNIEKLPQSEHKKKMLRKLEDSKPLLEKYIYCEMLKGGKIEDFQNTIFRYAETKDVNFDMTEKVKKITNEEINEILRDINQFHSLFSILDYRITLSNI